MEDFDCENNCGCYMQSKTADRGWCLPYMSLSLDNVFSCQDYTHRLCKELTCIAVNGFGYGVCAESFESQGSLSSECTSNKDCEAKNNNFQIYSDCACGFSSKGIGYCRPTLGDPSGKRFRGLLKRWYNSDRVLTCHSHLREASACMEGWEDYNELLFAYYGYYWGVEVQHNSPCVKSTLTAEYWEVYRESGAVVAVMSLLVVSSLF
jgi:hypothetical protein